MSEFQNRKRRQVKISRIEIVSELYKRGYNMRKVQAEVMKRLALKTYSLQTVHRDIHSLLDEWKKNRLENTDHAIQLELERIDDTVRELWDQWEKSKQDYEKTSEKKKGSPVVIDNKSKRTEIKTYQTEKTKTEVIRLGDVSFIAEIRAQLVERRKLLGLYAPEQKEFNFKEYDLGNLSPEQKAILIDIGESVLNETEQQN